MLDRFFSEWLPRRCVAGKRYVIGIMIMVSDALVQGFVQ
jgi:hypothetical protein